MNCLRLLTFCCFCLLFACTNSDLETENDQSVERFFDLSQYFKGQVKLLATKQEVQKKASINGKTESKTISTPDFKQELQLFIDSDINRTSWLDKYEVDSTRNATGNLTQLTYTALEDKLRTRKVAITFTNKEVTNVEILNATDNVIAQTKQELSYTPQQGYVIKSFQDILLAEPRTMEVAVNF
ncbi:MAG: hypothetical protein AB8G22_01610 [Saprospiraceae bacterium]